MSEVSGHPRKSLIRRGVDLIGSIIVGVGIVAYVGRLWPLAIIAAAGLSVWGLYGRRIKDTVLALVIAAALWAGAALDVVGIASASHAPQRGAATFLALLVLGVGRVQLVRWDRAQVSDPPNEPQVPPAPARDGNQPWHPLAWLVLIGVCATSSLLLGTSAEDEKGGTGPVKLVIIPKPIIVPVPVALGDVRVDALDCDAIGYGTNDDNAGLMHSLVDTYARYAPIGQAPDPPCALEVAATGKDGTAFQLVDRGPTATTADPTTKWYLVVNTVLDQTAWVEAGVIDAIREFQNVSTLTELNIETVLGGALEWDHACADGDFVPVVSHADPTVGAVTATIIREHTRDEDGSPTAYIVIGRKVMPAWVEWTDLHGMLPFPTSDETPNGRVAAQQFGPGVLLTSDMGHGTTINVDGLISRCR